MSTQTAPSFSDADVRAMFSYTYDHMDDEEMTENERIAEAASLLARHKDSKKFYQKMMDLLPISNRHADVQLFGEAYALNSLLRLSRRNPLEFQSVLRAIDLERIKHGREPFKASKGQKEYMRGHMGQKRKRQRLAVLIENNTRAPHEKLTGLAAMQFTEEQSRSWKSQLDAKIEAARATECIGGRRLPQARLSEIRSGFWAALDASLAEQAAASR